MCQNSECVLVCLVVQAYSEKCQKGYYTRVLVLCYIGSKLCVCNRQISSFAITFVLAYTCYAMYKCMYFVNLVLSNFLLLHRNL